MALEEDRISSLPDCLLIEILSRLDETKYAIRTGTLSKRWHHLWPQLSNLSFTHERCGNVPQFYSYLGRILRSQTHQVNKLKLQAFYNDHTEVNNCIRSAISRNVQEVDFDMTYQWCLYGGCRNDGFVLPDFFFTCSSFIRVSLCGCKFERAGVISWENLRTLHIEGAEIDQNMFENILTGCPLLETLELDRFGGFGFERIDITTNKSLKNLGLVDCRHIIHINAPYILSLAIKGRVMFMLVNVCSVIKAELNYYTSTEIFAEPLDIHEEHEMNEEMLKGHLLKLAHVKEVLIGGLCLETLARLKAKGFVIPSNLKVLGEIA